MDEQAEDHSSRDYTDWKRKKMEYAVKPEVLELTQKSKQFYLLFNIFELETNRFHALPEFALLKDEIVAFNDELQAWKMQNKEIKNIYLSYHLYKNLFSRMKYTSNLVLDREEARRCFAEIGKWFLEQKPKIRNKAPEKQKGILKPSSANQSTSSQIDSFLVSNAAKKDLKAYELMARTTYTEFFPPKERLLEYKRRDLLEGIGQRRALSVQNLSKGINNFKGSSVTTRTTFFKTATQGLSSRAEVKEQPAAINPTIAPFKLEEKLEEVEAERRLLEEGQEEEKEDMLEEMGRQKQIQQEQLLQENIVQVVNEEDQADEQQYMVSEEPEDKKYRKYRVDISAEDEMQAQQNVKDSKQSTLRRILKQKEEAVKRKMEELSMAQQIKNWGAIKSRQASEEHRKLERMLLANKFKKLEFVPKTLEERLTSRRQNIPEFNTFTRSSSEQPRAIQEEIEKIKINSALKTYGKYINHVDIVPVRPETEEEKQQMRVMRSTSLTSFCRQGKRAPFTSIVERHGPSVHNEDVIEHINKIKDRLAKSSIPAEKKQILMALGVPDFLTGDKLSDKEVYPPQNRMLSNPFFPKHLFQKKSKKKKK